MREVQGTRIGRLKFALRKQLRPIDISTYSSLHSFDGWCWPDGRAYSPKYFPHLVEPFPSGRLPDLRDFFKPYTVAGAGGLAVTPYQNRTPQHSHQITVSEQSPLTVRSAAFMWITGFESGHTEFGGTYYDGTGIPQSPAFHGASASDRRRVRLQPMSVRVPAGSSVASGFTGHSGEGGEAYPAYNDLPVLMFIGFPSL